MGVGGNLYEKSCPNTRAGFFFGLLFESQSFYKLGVRLCVFALKILEEAAALCDFLEKSTAGAEVLAVGFKVARELLYFFRKDCDLHLWGSGIGIVGAELFDDFRLFVFVEHRLLQIVCPSAGMLNSPRTKTNDD